MKYGKEYFENRGLHKHLFFEFVKWLRYLNADGILEPRFMFLGCGLGHRVYIASYYETLAHGIDLEYPIKNTPYDRIKKQLAFGDIAKDETFNSIPDSFYNVVCAYDVLEHMDGIQQVENTLKNMYKISNKYVIISVPVIGDKNLEADPTHNIKKSLEWWHYTIGKAGFNIIETPSDWLYRHQIILGVKK